MPSEVLGVVVLGREVLRLASREFVGRLRNERDAPSSERGIKLLACALADCACAVGATNLDMAECTGTLRRLVQEDGAFRCNGQHGPSAAIV